MNLRVRNLHKFIKGCRSLSLSAITNNTSRDEHRKKRQLWMNCERIVFGSDAIKMRLWWCCYNRVCSKTIISCKRPKRKGSNSWECAIYFYCSAGGSLRRSSFHSIGSRIWRRFRFGLLFSLLSWSFEALSWNSCYKGLQIIISVDFDEWISKHTASQEKFY